MDVRKRVFKEIQYFRQENLYKNTFDTPMILKNI